MAIKLTLEDGMTIEGSAEELAKFQRLTGVANVTPNIDESDSESERPTAGDYAVVAPDEIVEIIYDDKSDIPYYVKPISGDGKSRWVTEGAVERIDDGGRAPGVGDKILVVEPKFTANRYEKGDINTVKAITEEGAVYVKEHYIGLFRSEFVVLSEPHRDKVDEEEDVVLYERWADHLEISAGDIVRVIHDVCGHPVGTIGVAREGSCVEANGKVYDHSTAELVAKASDRVDRRE